MKDGLNRDWQQQGKFEGTFSGYTVQGFKYLGESGEVGWFTTSWPMKDPVHDFWISGTTFYRVKFHFAGNVSNRRLFEIFETIENVDPAERSAVLEAIQAWENQPPLGDQP
jgi:hypothetical protein